MVRIEYDGRCKGCMYAELELELTSSYNSYKDWSIRCTNEILCDAWERRTQNACTTDGNRILQHDN